MTDFKEYKRFNTYDEYRNYYGFGETFFSPDHKLIVTIPFIQFEVLRYLEKSVTIFSGITIVNNIDDYRWINHRLDGPVTIYRDGHKSWYINDVFITPLIKQWAKENDIDLDNLSEHDIALIKLTWSHYGN